MNSIQDARQHSHLAVSLTAELVAQASITPDDAGCQLLLIQHLEQLGFRCETMTFGKVTNLWARKGDTAPLLVFAGHTDVVPTGDSQQWRFNPFAPTLKDGMLYGRGSADMKGGIAAFIAALTDFLAAHQQHQGSIGLLITSDEEGPAIEGTVKVVEALQARGEHIDYCILGEPTAEKRLGDVIKVGRRGSLSGQLTIFGKQGHIAYPHFADNPIHRAMLALNQLVQQEWDQGNEQFPATSFQISNIQAGLGVNNVIPNELKASFNFRFSSEQTAEQLQQQVEHILDSADCRYQLDWTLEGTPWLTTKQTLIQASLAAIKTVTGLDAQQSTAGGISDGRFIAPTGAETIELGVLSETIHQIDERVAVQELIQLSQIYTLLLKQLLCK